MKFQNVQTEKSTKTERVGCNWLNILLDSMIIKVKLHFSQKIVTTLSCYDFDIHESILIILEEVLLRK